MSARTPFISFSDSWLRVGLGRTSTPVQKILSIVAFASALTLLAAILVRWQLDHQLRSEEGEAVQARMVQLGVTRPTTKVAVVRRTPSEVGRHNAAVGQLNIPWSDVFDGLERHASTEIGLTTLEPDTSTGTLHVQAEARNIASLLAYADQLSNDAAFSQLLLQQHETNEQDPNRPARLSFQVRLGRPGTDAKAGS